MGALDEFGLIPAGAGFVAALILFVIALASRQIIFAFIGIILLVISFIWLWLWRPYTKFFEWG